MSKRTFSVRFDGEFTVELDQKLIDAIDDDWRKTFYEDVRTPEDIAEHIAFACVVRGFRFSQLDGFNGLPEAKLHEGEWELEATEVNQKLRKAK
jgi:hypothetical protein